MTKHSASCYTLTRSVITRNIVYKNISIPSMMVNGEEWKQQEKGIMSKTYRNSNVRRIVIANEGNGFPNATSKREQFVDMGIVMGKLKARVNEHWRDY